LLVCRVRPVRPEVGQHPLAEGLVVLCWVEGEAAELGSAGVEDLDVAAGDEQDDASAAVGAADGDVVQAALVPEGDGAFLVEFVVADAVAGGVDAGAGGVGLLAGGVGGGGSRTADGPVGADLVVVAGEVIELGLELFLGDGRVLAGQVFS
jgi:hypothetical protein